MFHRLFVQADYQFDESAATIFSLLVDTATDILLIEHGLNGIEILSLVPFGLTVKARCDSLVELVAAGRYLNEVSHALNRVQLKTAHAPLDSLGPVRCHTMQLTLVDAP